MSTDRPPLKHTDETGPARNVGNRNVISVSGGSTVSKPPMPEKSVIKRRGS